MRPMGKTGLMINWKAIRPLNGSRQEAFEELCAQLARTETPPGGRFTRKGSPDSGVECFTVLPDGSEWGWQAKYFTSLRASQFRQLDRSVEAALAGHGKLVRYYICAPLDRSDARIMRRKSALQRWEEHIMKWRDWAGDRDPPIEFIWWGSSELLELLSNPQHIGRLRFWFGDTAFEQAWFESRLEEALQAAGPRYTPELHVEPSIGLELETFGRAVPSIDRIKGHVKPIRAVLRQISGVADPDNARSSVLLKRLLDAVDAGIQALSDLVPDPSAELPFSDMQRQLLEARSAAQAYSEALSNSQTHHLERSAENVTASPFPPADPFASEIAAVRRLQNQLWKTLELIEQTNQLANSQLLVLTGPAGTGKTHLLCDVTRKRIDEGSPTVLLMGQRFLSSAEPWSQARDLLDIRDVGLGEFVGALETAAQVANRRALLIIDAINEGRGREIWRPHLPSFLQSIAESAWIGVILSVRTPYEKQIISNAIRDAAVTVTHSGFGDQEYEAIQTFFAHYGLELPAGPLLQPEFRNPLFLKTVCQGLRMAGHYRLPQGFHGITQAFDTYLNGVNIRLAEDLGYDPHDPLVTRALKQIAELIAERPRYRLARNDVRDTVNTLLPNREYEQSIYRALVSEGILTEHLVESEPDRFQDVVHISYERYADHAVANALLERHLDPEAPGSAFEEGGGLEFLCRRSRCTTSGLLEALCIQVPERTGSELAEVAPEFRGHWAFREAFRQSLIWRDRGAFSSATTEMMSQLVKNRADLDATLEVMVTVACVPQHPLNAEYLHDRLIRYSMAERDVRWSIYLHYTYGEQWAVDRLVDWSLALSADDEISEVTALLCATALTWMLTTPNRFLRDRVTKALVALLSCREDAAEPLLRRFAGVDDLYVQERLYAAVYGVAMRSSDRTLLASLASAVYEQLFSDGCPPPHLLLRDYGRGVIERAFHLGSEVNLQEHLIRHPHGSAWPEIPNEAEFEERLDAWKKEFDSSGPEGSAGSSIMFSILWDDFGNYVIGRHQNWLAIERSQPKWRSWREQVRDFFDTLGEIPDDAWKDVTWESLAGRSSELATALEHAGVELPPDQRARLESLFSHSDAARRRAPHFDSTLIQRYVVGRVFELGWTVERFGAFDRFAVRSHGRNARKAERVGKKYQWIAYHEMLAYLTDHYQYRDEYTEGNTDSDYDGPWQEFIRDIDPSMLLRSKPGGTGFDSHAPSWWATEVYSAWEEESTNWEWIANERCWPDVERLLAVQHTSTNVEWLNVSGFFDWRQEHPLAVEEEEVGRRDLWIMTNGYYIASSKASDFISWARNVNFWGRWLPNVAEVGQMFFGEYGWSPAFQYFNALDDGLNPWVSVGRECPTAMRSAVVRCSCSPSDHDCSVEDGPFWLHVPDPDFARVMGLRWTGQGADFVDETGTILAFDPTAWEAGPTGLLVRSDSMATYLDKHDLSLCWAVLGEKRVLGGVRNFRFAGALQMSGAYVLTTDGLVGFVNYFPMAPHD